MTVTELKAIESAITNAIQETYNKGDSNRAPIYDGVVSPELYLNSPYRILWVLKEPYEGENGAGGGWKLGEDLLEKEQRHKIILRRLRAMHVMTYVTNGILNNKLFEEMNTIRKEPEISEVLTRIAWINVNKMPSLTHTRSKPLSNEYALWKNILLKQINEYVPEIIIFGNTFHYFRNDILDSTVTTIYKKTSLDYFIKNNQLFIDAYHPSQMTIKRKIYVNEIIETCREYIQNAR